MKRMNFSLVKYIITILLLTVMFGQYSPVNARPQAHTRAEIGPYLLILGWEEEPVIVGERNALVLEVTEDETAVTGVEGTLDVELLYGGRSFRTNLNPTVEPGFYTAEIFPTVRGQFAVRLFGTIGDLEVDEIIEPEEVLSASLLHFPEAQPDPLELEKEIETLTEELESTRTMANIGIGVGVLGILLAAVSLFRRK